MDIEKIKEAARVNFDHAVSRKLLHERIQSQLILGYNGGLFKVTPELLSFVYILPLLTVIIKDSYNNPVKIEDSQDFYLKATQKYHEVMNEWYVEYEKLKKIRNGKQLLEK